MMKWMNRKK